MNLKRCLMAVAVSLLSCSLQVFADDNYRESLKEYVDVFSSEMTHSKEKMVPKFIPLAVQMGFDASTADSLTNVFFDQKFMKEALDWLEEQHKPYVSEEDMKFALKFFDSEKGKLAIEHSKTYGDDQTVNKMTQQMMPDLMNLVSGGKVSKVETSAPKDYGKIFHEYYKKSGLSENMDVMVKQMFALVLGYLGGESKEFEKLKKNLTDYFDKNIETILMNAGYPNVTKEDLSFWMDFYKTPSGKKFSQVNASMMSNAVSFGMNTVYSFQQFLQEAKISD